MMIPAYPKFSCFVNHNSAKFVTFAFLLFTLFCTVSANWGGFSFGSHGGGSLEARGLDQVEMVSESLFIDLHNGFARVNVKYLLSNTGGPVTVRAGFPTFFCDGCPNKDNSKQITEFDVIDYTIKCDGENVECSLSKGTSVKWFRYEQSVGPVEPLPPGELSEMQVNWYVSEIGFAEKQSRTVTITYQSYYYTEGGGYSDYQTIFESDEFRYFLHTGASWKGPIQKGYVRIRAIEVEPDWLVLEPDNRFKREGNTFIWNFTDLEPTLADNILVNLQNNGQSIDIPSDQQELRTDEEWFQKEAGYLTIRGDSVQYFDQHFYSVSASSCLDKAKFSANMIADFAKGTAWAEGVKGSGIGEKLELELDFPLDLYAVGIMAGYYKSKETYFNNNRIAKLRISVNGNESRDYQLTDEYHHFRGSDYKAYQYLRLPETGKPVKHLTLTILDVYKGLKYDDTCISEVLLRKKFKERRNIRGGR